MIISRLSKSANKIISKVSDCKLHWPAVFSFLKEEIFSDACYLFSFLDFCCIMFASKLMKVDKSDIFFQNLYLKKWYG